MKRMYRPGRKLGTMAALDRELDRGNYVWLSHKPQHPAWVQSMTWRSLKQYVQSGLARVAVKNNKGEKNATAN